MSLIFLFYCSLHPPFTFFFFFFNDTATTEIYTLSLHDALPISQSSSGRSVVQRRWRHARRTSRASTNADRKSTRLNSSHSQISYAVFCLKKKKHNKSQHPLKSARISLSFPTVVIPTTSDRYGNS